MGVGDRNMTGTENSEDKEYTKREKHLRDKVGK